jgi:hypothetical protein
MNAQEFERQYEVWIRVLNSKMKDVFAMANSSKLKDNEVMDKINKIDKEEDKWLNELKRK